MAQLRSVTRHMGSPATRHKWTHPALTPAMQTNPGGMEGWVDLADLIAPRPEAEPATFRSRVQRSTNGNHQDNPATRLPCIFSGSLPLYDPDTGSQTKPWNFYKWRSKSANLKILNNFYVDIISESCVMAQEHPYWTERNVICTTQTGCFKVYYLLCYI